MKIVLVSHSKFSVGALKAAEMIIGETPGVAAFGLHPGMDGDGLIAKVVEWLDSTGDPEEEVLVLSDLFFGSPFNAMCALMNERKLYHVTGMNLAMIIEAISNKDDFDSAKELAEQIQEAAREGVVDANVMLESD